MRIVQKTREAWSKKNELNERGEALLFLMKLTKNHSFQELSTFFTLGDHTTAPTMAMAEYKLDNQSASLGYFQLTCPMPS